MQFESKASKARKAVKKEAKQARKTKKVVAKQARKTKKVEVKQAKKDATVQRKAAKVVRKNVRTDEKTTRITQRQTGRTTKAATKQAGRVAKVIGKQEIIRARQDSKLNKAQQSGALDPTFDPSSDMVPPSGAPGSAYMTSQVDGYDQPDENTGVIDIDYEEADASDIPEGEEEEYEEMYPDDEIFEPELSAPGLIGTLVKAAGGAIKGGIQAVTKTNAGKLVQKGVDVAKDYAIVKNQNVLLKQQIQQQKTTTIIVAVASVAGGALIGYLVAPKKK